MKNFFPKKREPKEREFRHEDTSPQDVADILQARKTRFLMISAACSCVFVILLFLFSPFFSITEVHVMGYSRVPRDEIVSRLELSGRTHILIFNTRSARNRLLDNMYIADVSFERVLPGRLHVSITERRLTAYVQHMPGSFLFLDDQGRVLDVRPYRVEPLPILDGLQITGFRLGEILDVPDTVAFSVIVQYAQLLNHHNLIDRVTRINVSDPANIRITTDTNVEFNVGGPSDADQKVRTIVAMLDALSDAGIIPGLTDISVMREEFIFEILQ